MVIRTLRYALRKIIVASLSKGEAAAADDIPGQEGTAASGGPGASALAECSRWAVVLACSAASGQLPLVGLKLLHDVVHLLYCYSWAALQVRTAPPTHHTHLYQARLIDVLPRGVGRPQLKL